MFQQFKDNNKIPTPSGQSFDDARGFTLIELMIVLAVIAVVMTLAIPTYSNYSIRTKMTEAVSQLEGAKAAASSTCQKDRTISEITNDMAGYDFKSSKYVQDIVLGGTCETPTIIMTTQRTGAKPNPVLTITGSFANNAGQITWICVSSGLNIHLPESCRS